MICFCFRILLVPVLFISCSGARNAYRQDHSQPTPATSHPNEKIYTLRISFTSAGEGINRRAHKEFESFLRQQENILQSYDKAPWGKEGEVDYCLDLSNLPENTREDFVSDAKKMLHDFKWVEIKENATCPYKNWGK